ncbi:50S ribosomal protein L31e [Candidatus Pacearchaeota archaeon]|nr:hypothetical protein [uncultured archaeon]AQS33214.1 hypothetical protein [uncultured archaeon]MBS3091566.1 50S ribosomal protein L31e [Candidatus Pacearchaeota archaeon]
MAETKTPKAETKKLEREYIIPLRKEWLKAPMYERTGKAIKAIKKFIAKHMKVLDRDVNNVRLDVYSNNELWFRGRANPPAKVKVRAVKEDNIVRVELVDFPAHVKFLKAKHEKLLKRFEKKEEAKEDKKEKKREVPAAQEGKTEEQKKDEKEKETATAEQRSKEFEAKAKEQKHVAKLEKQKSHPQRMALQK